VRLHVPRYAVRRHVDMGLREMRHALHSTAPAGRIYVVAGMRDSEPLRECECYSVDTYRPAGLHRLRFRPPARAAARRPPIPLRRAAAVVAAQ
jgi:hypothetical protein